MYLIRIKTPFGLLFSILLLLIGSNIVIAQSIPPNLSGEPLRNWLKQHYYQNNHNYLDYDTARVLLYGIIENKNDSIYCVYSDFDKYLPYGSNVTYPAPINCEHIIPQSISGGFPAIKSDLHQIAPALNTVNSSRSDHPFGEIPDSLTTKWMYKNIVETTKPLINSELYSELYYVDSLNRAFEPRESKKGNIARSVFYAYTFYGESLGPISEIGDPQTLFNWHMQDPADNSEANRNQLIATLQGNSNPYIEFPDLVDQTWEISTNPLVPSPIQNLQIISDANRLFLYWDSLNYNADGFWIYKSSDGISFSTIAWLNNNEYYNVDYLVTSNQLYSYYVVPVNAHGTGPSTQIISAQIGTTQRISELIFSEYIEGSGYNKGIELANYTDQPIDLSEYQLMIKHNDNSQWNQNGFFLNDTLESCAVYTIVNQNADSTLLNLADTATFSQVLSFNGNDVIGLFKNGTLIDAIGDPNSTSNGYFARDVTLLRRHNTVTPNPQFNLAEWEFMPQNDTSDFGQFISCALVNSVIDIIDVVHIVYQWLTGNLAGPGAVDPKPREIIIIESPSNNSLTQEALVYPNPVPSNVLLNVDCTSFSDYPIFFSLHNTTGQYQINTLIEHQEIHTIDVFGLPSGIYFYSITNNSQRQLAGKLVIAN